MNLIAWFAPTLSQEKEILRGGKREATVVSKEQLEVLGVDKEVRNLVLETSVVNTDFLLKFSTEGMHNFVSSLIHLFSDDR